MLLPHSIVGANKWMVKTLDSPETVHAFYSLTNHLNGWELIQDDNVSLDFRRTGFDMKIYISGLSNSTTILYTIEDVS